MVCISPFTVVRYGEENRLVPCGKCYNCISRKISQWSFRLQQQALSADSLYFLTMTYADHSLNIVSGYPSLCRKDVQLFYKRLRTSHQRSGISTTIKYYTVGEYGGRTQRPHYHAIIYNAVPELISKEWRAGHVHFGTVTPESVGYTLKYMCKRRKRYSSDPRTPEFSLSSNGLGLNYVTDEVKRFHAQGADFMYTVTDGKKVSMSRYLRNYVFDYDQLKSMSDDLIERALKADKAYTDHLFKLYKTPENVARMIKEFKIDSFNRLARRALKTKL